MAEVATIWVKMSRELLEQLTEGWSPPVQVKVDEVREEDDRIVFELTARRLG